ncbi:hypothetical protein [Rhizobium sp. OAE497]|uniref:hypothetical protein n=1 Tax=Rhizobium sp. OAE497 TaxID=2663796 RepID=UPI0018F59040
MTKSKYAILSDDVVDVISFEPDMEDGEVSPSWVPVPDSVFAGFIRQVDGSFTSPPPLPPSLSDYQGAIQELVDQTAQAEQFNDGVTLASYVASTVQPWAAQAQAFVSWRDNVWQYAYAELAKVQAGEREQPSVEAFLLELPEVIWP